jgi:hypothetical protein
MASAEATTAQEIGREIATGIADVLDGRRSREQANEEAREKGHSAWVKQLIADDAANKKRVSESPEAKRFPNVAEVALRLGWTFDEFKEACARVGGTLLADAA